MFFNILSEVPLSIERWELGVMQLHTQRGPPLCFCAVSQGGPTCHLVCA